MRSNFCFVSSGFPDRLLAHLRKCDYLKNFYYLRKVNDLEGKYAWEWRVWELHVAQ